MNWIGMCTSISSSTRIRGSCPSMMVLCWSSSSPPLRSSGAWADIATEAIELGDDQHVAGLQPVEQAREAAPLRGGDIPRHGLRDHAAGLDLEARRFDLLQLIVRRLARGGDAEVDEGARHG